MEPLRVVIVDDEAAARSRLRRLLRAEPDVRIVAEAVNGKEAIAVVRTHDPDVLFLDVQMPGLDGFAVIEALPPDRLPAVVFVTAWDRYALRAFEARAVDYLLKPFDDERLADALDNVRRRTREGRSAAMRDALLALITEARAPSPMAESGADRGVERIPVPGRDGILLVDPADVGWVEAADDYVCLHAGPARHLVRGTLARFERRLAPGFVRIHRSALVRKDAVRRLTPRSHGDYDVTLDDGTVLRLSRQYRDAFAREMGMSL